MKKYFVIIAFLAAAVSCGKDDNSKTVSVPAEPELVHMTFHVNGEGTKTTLDKTSIIWSTSDKINVFSGASFGTNTQFSVTSTEADGHVATFEGLAAVSPVYYALFPYQAGASINASGFISATLPTDQAAKPDTFGPEANVSIACISGDDDLVFKNIGALLSVTIDDPAVNSIRIESLNGELMTGDIQISYSDGNPRASVSSGQNYVQTSVSGIGTYYFVVLPGTYAGGFKTTLYRSGYTASIQSTASLSLERNDNVFLTDASSVPAAAWKPVFTPGENVYIKGLSDPEEDGQQLSYIYQGYYSPRPGGSAPVNPAPGDEAALAGITYNYEVWAKINVDDEVYFETDNGARFAVNIAADAVAPIAPDAVGPKISVSDSPYRIRLNLPSGDAQVVRVSIVNYGIIYGDVSQNLVYDKTGTWKLSDYPFAYATNQSWDPTLSRYRFSVWFNWKGGQGGGNIDVWQRYGTCTLYNNLNIKPATDDPGDSYYYVQPFAGDDWDEVFYLPDWLFNGGVNLSRKGTLSLHMNADYGHFTHGFSDVVDNQ